MLLALLQHRLGPDVDGERPRGEVLTHAVELLDARHKSHDVGVLRETVGRERAREV